MRLVNLTDAIISNLRNIASTPINANVSGQERQFLQLTISTAEQVTNLPEYEIPRPDDHTEELTLLQTEVSRLTTENTRLQAMVDRLLAQPAREPREREDRAEKLPDIPMFGGKQSELRPWMDRLTIKIGDRQRYPDVQGQLRYALSRLEGTAFDHVRPHLQNDGTINLVSVQALTTILERAFDDPDREGTARRTILTIRQGSEDFATLYAKFQAQVPYARMDDGALLAAMKEAVAPKIRQAMIGIRPRPATLAGYVELARDIDADQRAEAERRSGTPSTTTAPPKPRPAPRATSTTATGTEPGPMDLSRQQGARRFPRLSEMERERRIRSGLCFRCGGQGHRSTECPSQGNRNPATKVTGSTTTVAAISARDPQEESLGTSSTAATEQSEN